MISSKLKQSYNFAMYVLGNATQPLPDAATTQQLLKRIANVDLNCCNTRFADIVDLVEHLKSLNHLCTSVRNFPSIHGPGALEKEINNIIMLGNEN